MCDDNGKTLFATLDNILLALDLCNNLISIIMLMNAGHTCLFRKVIFTVYFGVDEKNAVTLTHSAQRKHAFEGEIENMSKEKENTSKKEIFFRIATSEIRAQINQIIDSWGYCQCLGRCSA